MISIPLRRIRGFATAPAPGHRRRGTSLALILAAGTAAAPCGAAAGGPAATPFRVVEFRASDRVGADGSVVREERQTVDLLEAGGVAAYSQIGVAFFASFQEADIVRLEIHKADGRDLDKLSEAPRQIADLLPPVLPVYSDLKVLRLAVPALEPGDRLTFETRVRSRPLAPGKFWAGQRFASARTVGSQTYELDLPESLAHRLFVRPDLGATMEERREAGRFRRVWRIVAPPEGADGKGAEAEDDQPLDVLVSSFESWNDLATWWGSLAEPSLDDALRKKAAELTAGQSSPREKFVAIERFVASEIRYLALPLGIGRYEPRAPGEVLRTGLGDCKDKVRLVASLALAAGIRVDPVYLSVERRELVEAVPDPLQFDHVIGVASAGGEEIWFDATSEMTPTGRLPKGLRGHRALRVSRDGGRYAGAFVETPSAPPVPVVETAETTGAIGNDGVIRARVRWTFSGDDEPWRLAFKYGDDAARRKVVGILRSEWDEGTTVGSFRSGDPTDLTVPFWIEYELEYRMSSNVWREPWTFWIPVPKTVLEAPPEKGSTRREVRFEEAPRQLRVARFEIPEGVQVTPPVPVARHLDFADYRSDYRVEGRTLVLERELDRRVDRLDGTRFGDVEALRKLISDDRSQEFGLAADAGVAAAAGAPDAAATLELCDAALDAQDNQEAEKRCRQATELDASRIGAWRGLGRALTRLGRLDEAEAAYRRETELDPNDDYAWAGLGLVAWERGDLKAAERFFRQQVEKAPLGSFGYRKLGRLLTYYGDPDEAAKTLRTALKLDPTDVEAFESLLHLESRRGNAGVLRELVLDGRRPSASLAARAAAATALAAKSSGAWAPLAPWFEAVLKDAVGSLVRCTDPEPKLDELAAVWALGAAWEGLGHVALEAGHAAESERYFDSATRLLQASAAAFGDAQALRALGRNPEADLRLAMATQMDVHAVAEYSAALEKAVPAAELRGRLTTQASQEWLGLRSLQRSIPAAAGSDGELWLIFGADGRLRAASAIGASGPRKLAAQLVRQAPSLRLRAIGGFEIALKGLAHCGASGDCLVIFSPPADTWGEAASKPNRARR